MAPATTCNEITSSNQAIPLTLTVNGHKQRLRVEPWATLLDVLRERLDLTGSKKGCDHGQCGACTVLVDGRSIHEALRLSARGRNLRGRARGRERSGALHRRRYNLVDLMKDGVEQPAKLVDINALALRGIGERDDGQLRLGALATNAETAYDPRVAARYPVLSSAILAGASAQLRNAATNGGNLNQRTRCYYFTYTAAPATSACPDQAAALSAASTASTRSSARVEAASPPIRRTCAWRCSRLMRGSGWRARMANG